MGILVLLFLGWLASERGRPLTFGGLFALYILIISLVFGGALRSAIAAGLVGFGAASLYFLLLWRCSDSTALWLVILIGVPVAWAVFRFQALA